jgi:hypothetical protein
MPKTRTMLAMQCDLATQSQKHIVHVHGQRPIGGVRSPESRCTLYQGKHAEAAVPAAEVVPDLEVVQARVGKFNPSLATARVDHLHLHARPE